MGSSEYTPGNWCPFIDSSFVLLNNENKYRSIPIVVITEEFKTIELVLKKFNTKNINGKLPP